MTLFMVLTPLVLPFFVVFLKGAGLPARLDWWKALGSGMLSFVLYLFIAWILSFPAGMIPSFTRDLLYWSLHLLLALGLAAWLGMLFFRSSLFSGFLTEETVFPFMMGLYLFTGIDNIVRYIHVDDPLVLFGLPLIEFFYLAAAGLLLFQALESGGWRRLLSLFALLPLAFLLGLVPALFYSFQWLASLVLLCVSGGVVIWLTARSSLV